MRIQWSGHGKWKVTVYKYERVHDTKGYNKACNNRGLHAPYPDYQAFYHVYNMGFAQDYTTTLTDTYDPTKQFVLPVAPMTDRELCDAPLTLANCEIGVRDEQAAAFKRLGYHGPIGGGEARGLKNTFTELGMTDLVRRGFFRCHKTVTRPPTRYQIRSARWNGGTVPGPRQVNAEIMQYCYVFKSPLPNVPFEKFIKLARMYRGDKGGLRAAVKGVLANPEAHAEVETIDAIDMLSKMAGMN